MTATQPQPGARPDPGPHAGVPEAFDDVAGTYDLMVGLSPGYRAQLRRSCDALVEALPARPADGRRHRLVDLGCGSGLSTRALVDALAARGVDADVVGVDGSAGMLARARRKRGLRGVTFVQADAERLAAADLGGTVDGVLAAYLFRNVAARDRLVAQVRGALSPGGVLVVHDYSVRESARARLAWHAVCWGVIIPLGVLTAPGSGLYRYLWRSVLDFDGVTGLARRLGEGGFRAVEHRSVRGWQAGQVHTWRARA